MLQQSRRRVLHVVPSISALRGGTSSAIWTILHALRLRGIVADLVTTDDDGAAQRLDVPFGEFTELNGNRVQYFPRQLRPYAVSAPLLSWLKQHADDYDLIHTHGLFTFAPLAAAYVARSQRVPFLMCPHGTLERWCLNSGRAFLKRVSLRTVEGPLLAAAAGVHFTSHSELEQARDIGFPMKGAVIPLGLELPPQDDSMPPPPRFGDRPTVLFLSRIDAKKGLDLLLTAFANVRLRWPEALLLVAGDGPETLKSSLREQAHRLGLDANIRWLGFVTGREKQDLLAEASVFVLPSWSENFGVAVAEAMAAAVPVIVTKAVGVSELIEPCGAGHIVERSAEAVEHAIVQTLSDTAGRRRMGEAGRRVVREHLSLETFGARLESLYGEVCSR